MNPDDIKKLAAETFKKQEYVRMLEMMNTPIDYEERKQAFIELQLARYEAKARWTMIM